MSLSDFPLSKTREMAERPTIEEPRTRSARHSAVTPSVAPAQAIRAERDRQRSWSMPLHLAGHARR